jgi:rod shape-determining protein MreC
MLILRWLASQALKGREILSILFVFGFCLWLSSRPEAVQKGWRKGFATTIFLPVHMVVENLHFRWGLEKELAEVRKDNARLLAENAKLSEVADIRSTIGEFEGVRPRLEFPFIGARVISRDPVRLGGIWILDEGAAKGIGEGMAVISSRGVVGRILASTGAYSQMQSLSDPDCRIAVISVRSRNPGIVHSPEGSGVFVEYGATSDIRVGDSLVTWGAGGIFPRGLPVGRVVEIRKTTHDIMRQARIEPFQNPWEVRDVFVLLRPPILRVGGDSLLAVQPSREEVP